MVSFLKKAQGPSTVVSFLMYKDKHSGEFLEKCDRAKHSGQFFLEKCAKAKHSGQCLEKCAKAKHSCQCLEKCVKAKHSGRFFNVQKPTQWSVF